LEIWGFGDLEIAETAISTLSLVEIGLGLPGVDLAIERPMTSDELKAQTRAFALEIIDVCLVLGR
jgi:hypothetical protein